MDELPTELLIPILVDALSPTLFVHDFLTYAKELSLICEKFNNILSSEYFWKTYYVYNFGDHKYHQNKSYFKLVNRVYVYIR